MTISDHPKPPFVVWGQLRLACDCWQGWKARQGERHLQVGDQRDCPTGHGSQKIVALRAAAHSWQQEKSKLRKMHTASEQAKLVKKSGDG